MVETDYNINVMSGSHCSTGCKDAATQRQTKGRQTAGYFFLNWINIENRKDIMIM